MFSKAEKNTFIANIFFIPLSIWFLYLNPEDAFPVLALLYIGTLALMSASFTIILKGLCENHPVIAVSNVVLGFLAAAAFVGITIFSTHEHGGEGNLIIIPLILIGGTIWTLVISIVVNFNITKGANHF